MNRRLRITAYVLIFMMIMSTMAPFANVRAASEYETKIATAEKELCVAQSKLTELKKTAATAKTAYEKAKPTAIEASLIGFLMDSTYGMGWSNALAYFNNNNVVAVGDSSGKKYTDYTTIGQSDVATSLNGLICSLELFEEGNNLRKKEGVSSLKVSARAMLAAATECNYYAKAGYYDHSDVAGMMNNLAKCYEDPFDGWYTREKADYEAGNYAKVGHYLTLIDKDYLYGGFAMIVGDYKGSYAVALNRFCHTFERTSTDTVIMDVSTVKTKAKNYINYINNYGATEKAAYEKAQAAVTAQEKVVAEKQNALTSLKPTSVSLSNSTLSLKVGSSSKLTATVKPSTAYSAVTWTTATPRSQPCRTVQSKV